MRTRFLTLGFVSVLLVGQSLWGQTAPHGIRGYLDARTGTFHMLPSAASDETVSATTTTFAGKFIFSFTITVDATISSTAKIACSASATVEDNITGGNPNFILEEASALATRSGSTATCTVNIPYSWNLATGSSDKVMLAYTISAPAEASASASLPSRLSEVEDFATIAVPTTGTTTTETVTATF
jgi:hypothetical protein